MVFFCPITGTHLIDHFFIYTNSKQLVWQPFLTVQGLLNGLKMITCRSF